MEASRPRPTKLPETPPLVERALNHSIGIATTTFYREWFPGEVDYLTIKDPRIRTDKVRGDLAIQMLTEAHSRGFQLIVVDGGSSPEFQDALRNLGIPMQQEEKDEQKKTTMSGSRRQAMREVSKLEGVEVIAWTEPEKISFVKDILPEVAKPILVGEADIVIPKRDTESFATYPDYQAAYEQRANELWNEILRRHPPEHPLLSQGDEDLDMWFGPRLIRKGKDAKILELFMQRHNYYRIPNLSDTDTNEQQQREFDQIYNPELWPDATFLPVIEALHAGLRVKSVLVHYEHPQAQTASEQDSEDFRRKRDIQYKNIVIATMNLILQLEGNPKSRFTLS